MKQFIVILLLTVTIHPVLSQGTIEGKVIDSSDRSEIPFVNITSIEGRKGTASYTDGSFIISIDKFPVTLVFSHVSYGKTEITFTSPSQKKEILLIPLTTELSEVVISALDPIHIVSATFETLSMSTSSLIANGFYRQWTKNDNLYSELIESFYTSKINTKGVEIAGVSQGRYAMKDDAEKGLMTNKNFSVFTNTFPLAQITERSFLTPLRKNADDFFTFKVIKVVKGNSSNKITVISFEPNQSNNLPGFAGQLYIDDNYNLIRFNGFIEDKRFKPLGTVDPNRVSELRLDIDIFCDNKVDNILLLENIKVDLNYIYRYDGKNSRKVHTSSFYFVYETSTVDSQPNWNDYAQSNDYSAINNSKYDETFWEKTNVLSQTPIEKEIIKQFKKSNLFKQVFQK